MRIRCIAFNHAGQIVSAIINARAQLSHLLQVLASLQAKVANGPAFAIPCVMAVKGLYSSWVLRSIFSASYLAMDGSCR